VAAMNSESFSARDIRQTVRAEERHRLAVELHDSIGQVLCLARLQLFRIQDALRQPFDAGRQAWLRTTLDTLIPEIDTAVHAIQQKIFSVDLTALTAVGLTATLDQKCAAFIHRTGTPCERRFESLDLEAEQSALVVLIVREALSNVARHSEATNVEVVLQHAGERGILTVRDDGRGMERSRMTAISSIGLRGMDERARALGGDLTLDSKLQKGTRITLSFPLRPRQQSTSLLD
jgi:two-component system, NarL family, sensor histidine kinase UhpB